MACRKGPEWGAFPFVCWGAAGGSADERPRPAIHGTSQLLHAATCAGRTNK